MDGSDYSCGRPISVARRFFKNSSDLKLLSVDSQSSETASFHLPWQSKECEAVG
jgi:hypothetical protein